MVLYRREWEWVHSRLSRLHNPTTELRTLTQQIKLALEVTRDDPFNLAITDSQMRWINERCKLITFHTRPEHRKQAPVKRHG